MTDVWKVPTAQQRAQAELVQQDLIEEINRLIREGIDYRVVLAGVGSATADLIASTLGAAAVAPWHDMQAKLVREALG